jgi:uncharacterized circularly permuted ATP-grasp superfamily protein
MKSTFPQVFDETKVRPVADYPGRLLDLLQVLAPHTPSIRAWWC